MELPNFKRALTDLGPTDIERAKALGVPVRTFVDYKNCRLPMGMRRLLHPTLLRALADDTERVGQTEASQLDGAEAAEMEIAA